MNSLVKEVGKGMSERLSDPLLGSFTISFLFWNWKFFFILFFSSGTASGRMYLALLEFNCISGFGVPIGLSLLYVLWRSFIPKWLDIFKDYCEKLLDRWSLIDVYNTAQLKNEIFKLNKLIRKMYSENYKLRYEYLDIIDLKEIDNSEQKDHIVGFKDYETSRHIKLELFNNNKIKYFYFIVEKTENYVLIYKSIHNKITRFNIAGDINNRKRIETWEAGTSFTDYIDIKDGEYIWRGNK